MITTQMNFQKKYDNVFYSSKELFSFASPSHGKCSAQMMTDCKQDFELFKEIVFDESIIKPDTTPLFYGFLSKKIF